MTKGEIEDWLVKSYKQTVETLALGEGWWPTLTGNNQQHASAWSWGLFALAAKSRCAGRHLTVAAHNSGAKGKVLEKLWPKDGKWRIRDIESAEVLVDFSVHHWKSSNPVQLTAESEMGGQHPIPEPEESGDLTANDYAWDLAAHGAKPNAPVCGASRLSQRGQLRCTPSAIGSFT